MLDNKCVMRGGLSRLAKTVVRAFCAVFVPTVALSAACGWTAASSSDTVSLQEAISKSVADADMAEACGLYEKLRERTGDQPEVLEEICRRIVQTQIDRIVECPYRLDWGERDMLADIWFIEDVGGQQAFAALEKIALGKIPGLAEATDAALNGAYARSDTAVMQVYSGTLAALLRLDAVRGRTVLACALASNPVVTFDPFMRGETIPAAYWGDPERAYW